MSIIDTLISVVLTQISESCSNTRQLKLNQISNLFHKIEAPCSSQSIFSHLDPFYIFRLHSLFWCRCHHKQLFSWFFFGDISVSHSLVSVIFHVRCCQFLCPFQAESGGKGTKSEIFSWRRSRSRFQGEVDIRQIYRHTFASILSSRIDLCSQYWWGFLP